MDHRAKQRRRGSSAWPALPEAPQPLAADAGREQPPACDLDAWLGARTTGKKHALPPEPQRRS